MMALSWNLQYFQNQWLSLRPLTLVLAVIGLFSVTGGVTQLRGEVGQNVTFHCPSQRNRPIQFFYFQRDKRFVNGYHASKDIREPKWENTILDNKTAVHMFKLNVSHSGTYDCVFQYTDNEILSTTIHLTVTAKYSKPIHTISCDRRIPSCLVSCASQGGYPSSKIRWSGGRNTSTQMWKAVNNSEVADPYTKLFSISSVVSFNCSYGEQKFLSCSVDNATSEMFDVCKPVEPTEVPDDHTIMIAAICAVAVVVIVPLLLWTCRKKRQTGAAAGAVRPEEVIVLQGINGKEEAS